MKWNILIASLVLSVGLCAQGFGFELLDRMLGVSGCGCHTSCCDSKPACGCEAAPACGCEAKHDCGCEPTCCKKRCRVGLLDSIFGCHSCKRSCCSSCGCDAAPSCGCGAANPAKGSSNGDVAPMPPAPVVDPSAFVPSQQQNVVHASSNLVR